MAPSLSFLIPVYNVQDYLDACVSSVIPATQAGDEIILVNDGSLDASGAMCDAWAARHPDRIKVIHQANVGLAATRNRAILASASNYICFLDSDDVLCGETLPAVREALASMRPDVLTCDAILWREGYASKQIKHSIPAGTAISGHEALNYTLADNFLSSCCRVFSASYLRSSGPIIFPVNRAYEDNSAIPLLIHGAHQVYYLPLPLFRYRVRAGSITQTQTLRNCLDQATSLAPLLTFLEKISADTRTQEMANVLALSHIIVAVRHASAVPGVRLADFTNVIQSGISTLTLRGNSLFSAVDRCPQSGLLRRHVRGMSEHPLRYATLRLIAARWKRFYSRFKQRT